MLWRRAASPALPGGSPSLRCHSLSHRGCRHIKYFSCFILCRLQTGYIRPIQPYLVICATKNRILLSVTGYLPI